LPPGSQEPGGFFADFYTNFTRIIRKSSKAPLHFRQDCATMKNINSFFLFLKKWQNG